MSGMPPNLAAYAAPVVTEADITEEDLCSVLQLRSSNNYDFHCSLSDKKEIILPIVVNYEEIANRLTFIDVDNQGRTTLAKMFRSNFESALGVEAS